MFNNKAHEKRQNPVVITETERPAMGPQALAATPVSCIGSGMTIVGTVECNGPAHVLGRIEGEVRASELVIGEGAHVEGSIQAQEVTISGRVKGTVRAIRVTLQGGAVEGDIVHRTLSIDESSVFEGTAKRVDNPVERRDNHPAESASKVAAAAAKKVTPAPAPVASAPPLTNGASLPN